MRPTIPCKDAWARARDRYVEDLSEEEKTLYEHASPESLFYDASAAEKVHTSNSMSLNIMNKLQPLIAAIEQYGQALDVFSNAYSLVMSPLWGSIRVLLHLAREFGKYFERIVEMLARIGDVLPRFRVYENLFPNHERLIQALSVAYVDIISFCTKSKAVFRHGQRSSLTNLSIAFKLSWKPFERQFGQQIDAFRVHLKNVEKEAGLSHMIEAADARAVVLANQKQLEKAKKESNHLRIIAAIPSVNNEGKHKMIQSLRYEGTGAWILQHEAFQQWKNSAQSSTLCCYGIPGCGKTVLASTIIDGLHTNESPRRPQVVYYYCDYADQRTLQIDRIIGTLLKQFFVSGHIPEEIETQIPPGYGEGRETLGTNELMDLLCLAVKLSSPTFVVLDGLDECENKTRQQMISFLNRLSGFKTVVVNTLVLCRESDQLLRFFQGTPWIRITPSALEGDIKSFVSGSVSSRVQSGELRIRNQNLELEIVSELVSKAHGMFLWVFFQLDDLCEALSDAMIRETLRNLPDGLAATYERILMKIGQNPMKSNVARKIFIWTICAQRPMRIDEVREAVAFEPSDKFWDIDKIPDDDLMIESCKGLIIREQDDGTVRFAHHTVRQYLLTELAGKQYSSFACTIHEAELFVGRMCLTYLSFADFDTQIEVRTPHIKVERPPDVLQSGPALWIPNLVGIRSSLFDLPYRLLRGHSSTSAPSIDFSKYINAAPTEKDNPPPQELLEKYRLLEYIIEHWMFYTRHFEQSSSELYQKLQEIAKNKTLSFEFRPWGSNQHHGPYGCASCAPVGASELAAKRLPFMSLFHYAAKVGHRPLMEPLVDEYCSHERGDDETLLIACRNGQQSIVEWLTREHDFDLSNGKAINAAVASGNEKILTCLLDLRDNSDPISPYSTFSVQHYGHIPLSLASANGHEAIVEILCQRGAPINKKIDDSGKTALSAAASNGQDHVVRNLIAKRARLLQTGTTPLHCAAENGHDVVVRTILQTDAHYDHKDDPPNLLPIAHLVSALDREEETPLHKAARNGHSAVVEVLLELSPVMQNWISAGTKPLPHWGGLEKQMAIHLAASNGHVGVLELLSSRVSIDSRTSRGRTPLLVAAAEGHVPAIQWLYRNGANTNMVDENGHNAIATAVIRGHEEAVQALVVLQQPITTGLLVLAAAKRQEAVLTTLIERVPENLLKEAWKIALAEKQVKAAQLLSTFLDNTVSEASSE